MGICIGEIPRRAVALTTCEDSHHLCPTLSLVCCIECPRQFTCGRTDKCPKATITNHTSMTCMKRRRPD